MFSDKRSASQKLEDAPDSYEANSSPEAKPAGRNTKSHFKKWWWVYLAVFIAIVLLVVLPV